VPGSQKLTPPSSASAIPGGDTIVANATAAIMIFDRNSDLRLGTGVVKTASLLPLIVFVVMVSPFD